MRVALRSAVFGFGLAMLASSVSAQTLTIGVRGGPDSIDPHFHCHRHPCGIAQARVRHARLVRDGLELEPRLAESWKPLNDTTWEFKLRKGVKFHDAPTSLPRT